MHHLTNILVDLIFILLHFFVFVFTYYLLDKKISQPAVLFSLVWLIIIVLHFVFKFTLLDELEPLSPHVYSILLIGNLFFSAGSILVYYRFRKAESCDGTDLSAEIQTSLLLRVILVVIILVGLPFYIQAAFKIFLASQAENFFSGLRYELSYGDADIGPLKYLMPFSYVIYAFNLYAFYNNKNTINRILLIITFLLISTYAVFSTGRTYFFMILTIYLGVSFFVKKDFSIKKYLAPVGIFMILFMVIGVIYGKGGDTSNTLNDNIHSSSENMGVYLVSSLNALDMETSQHYTESSNGDNTLRFFVKGGMQLDLIPKRKINELVQDFVFVPYATNVYTFYSPYIRDFGKLYAWLTLALIGAFHTWLYHKAANRKSKRAIFYYTFLLFPLLLSFFADLYLTLFSFWLQLVFFTEMLFIANKLFVLKKW